jgi:hypothetical protein
MASKIDVGTTGLADIDAKAPGAGLSSADGSDVDVSSKTDGSGQSREAFLASFSAAENHRIIRKVDRRFLLIIGMMYILKNVSLLLLLGA